MTIIDLKNDSKFLEHKDAFRACDGTVCLVCKKNNEDKYIVVDLNNAKVMEPQFDLLEDLIHHWQPQPNEIYKDKELKLIMEDIYHG